ncbi:hypothetical protein TOK_2465 [Pseudonocardia sp. N23]|nr:hypothetical protein TOK_2465 [Pseudonocardia sp. N23]
MDRRGRLIGSSTLCSATSDGLIAETTSRRVVRQGRAVARLG